jgi:DHA1 family bicyclomycin/chloramphenicol resistance-like MFS transporter
VEQKITAASTPPKDDGTTPWKLLALLMTMTAIGSMSLNILVPAVPKLVEVLASDTDTVQLTISLYIFGLATAQLFTGPLSDRFGRRPVILAGFSLATLASLGAIAMSNAPGLIAMRFIQAIGGATGVAIGRAIIRDLFGRERSAQMIGLVASAMAIAPMLAPLIGGVLESLFGWQSIFVFAATASLIVLIWTFRTLPETRAVRAPGAEPDTFRKNIGTLFRNRRFIGYVLSAALGSGAFFVYVGAGPHVIITMMQRTSAEYGLWFIPTAMGYIIGNFCTSRLSVRFGIDRMLWWGNVVNVLGAICGIALLFYIESPLPIAAAGTIMGIGNGIMLPNAIAGAVSIRPQAAGTASGLLGCTQMLFGAITAQFAGHLIAGATTAWPMLLFMLAISLAAVLVFFVLVRPHPMPAHK